MNKLLSTTLLILFSLCFFSCSNNSDDDSVPNKEQSIEYYFVIGSVLDPDNDEEKTYEVYIDGETYKGTSPSTLKKIKKVNLNETHIKFKLNSKKKTNVVYELRYGGLGIDSKYLAGGTFQDELDTIIKIKRN